VLALAAVETKDQPKLTTGDRILGSSKLWLWMTALLGATFLGRRALWSRFGADYAAPASDDVELACLNVLFKWNRDGESALGDALPLWFTGSSTPDACEPAFTALVANGSITAADRRARFRLASEAGNLKLAQVVGGDATGRR